MASNGQQGSTKNSVERNCLTLYCINKAREGRKYCHKCRNRKYVENNMVMHAYHNLKGHATERHLSFTLTFSRWQELCLETNYHLLKGKGANDLTIDRPDSTRGYADDNISVKTNRDNVIKQHTVDRDQRMAKMQEEMRKEYGGDLPF